MHETVTMQAVRWNARALAVRHQPSSWKHLLNLHRGRELRIFGRFYVKKTWRCIAFAYSASRTFFRRIFGGWKFGGEYG